MKEKAKDVRGGRTALFCDSVFSFLGTKRMRRDLGAATTTNVRGACEKMKMGRLDHLGIGLGMGRRERTWA